MPPFSNTNVCIYRTTKLFNEHVPKTLPNIHVQQSDYFKLARSIHNNESWLLNKDELEETLQYFFMDFFVYSETHVVCNQHINYNMHILFIT